jgi:hypothetical protein
VPAGKAVLHLDNEQAGANARVLTISDDVTGVNGVKGVMEVKDDSFFDLQGRRVLNAQKGLYIQNGRKVVVK